MARTTVYLNIKGNVTEHYVSEECANAVKAVLEAEAKAYASGYCHAADIYGYGDDDDDEDKESELTP